MDRKGQLFAKGHFLSLIDAETKEGNFEEMYCVWAQRFLKWSMHKWMGRLAVNILVIGGIRGMKGEEFKSRTGIMGKWPGKSQTAESWEIEFISEA